MVGGDDDRDQRIVQGLVMSGHVLGVLRDPVSGGDHAELDPMSGLDGG